MDAGGGVDGTGAAGAGPAGGGTEAKQAALQDTLSKVDALLRGSIEKWSVDARGQMEVALNTLHSTAARAGSESLIVCLPPSIPIALEQPLDGSSKCT